jgi:hypothetical protein
MDDCPECGASLATGILAAEDFRQFYFHAKAFTAEKANRKVELRITDK